MASGSIRVICPNLRCRTLLSVPGSARGKKVRCRSCGMKVTIPALAAKPADETLPDSATTADNNQKK